MCVMQIENFGKIFDTHDKLQYRNNYNHWKILDLFLDLSYN